MVNGSNWMDTFDGVVAFRRWVRASFGVPMRAELKANYLLRNGGPLRSRPLSECARFKLYRSHMRIQDTLGMSTFAVVIDKVAALSKFGGGRATSDIAWEYLLQRLDRRAASGGTQILVVHYEGDPLTIRKRARKARRAGTAGSSIGTGLLSVPFTRLLDDPVSRDSRQSYFLQLADRGGVRGFQEGLPASVTWWRGNP
jgi:hypothetical protein